MSELPNYRRFYGMAAWRRTTAFVVARAGGRSESRGPRAWWAQVEEAERQERERRWRVPRIHGPGRLVRAAKAGGRAILRPARAWPPRSRRSHA